MDSGAVRASAHRLFGAPSPAVSDTPPLSAEAAHALDVAGCWALERRTEKGTAEIRTEHVLAAWHSTQAAALAACSMTCPSTSPTSSASWPAMGH